MTAQQAGESGATAEPARQDDDDAQRDDGLGARDEVVEQGRPEDVRGRSPRSAGQLVGERLLADREAHEDHHAGHEQDDADGHRGPGPATRQEDGAAEHERDDERQPLQDRGGQPVDGLDLGQAGGVGQHDLPVGVGDGDVGGGGDAAVDQLLLDGLQGDRGVEDEVVAVEPDDAAVLALEDEDDALLGRGVELDPHGRELLRRDEARDELADEAVDAGSDGGGELVGEAGVREEVARAGFPTWSSVFTCATTASVTATESASCTSGWLISGPTVSM